eukprot:6358257-Prymnesium_polylepis.2
MSESCVAKARPALVRRGHGARVATDGLAHGAGRRRPAPPNRSLWVAPRAAHRSLRTADAALGEALDEDATGAVLADRERVGRAPVRAACDARASGCEEVVQRLVVDLKRREPHVAHDTSRARVDLVEELAEQPRHDAGLGRCAEHRVRLARARLPVGEQAAVVAVERLAEQRARRACVRVGLRRALAQHNVEAKRALMARDGDGVAFARDAARPAALR